MGEMGCRGISCAATEAMAPRGHVARTEVFQALVGDEAKRDVDGEPEQARDEQRLLLAMSPRLVLVLAVAICGEKSVLGMTRALTYLSSMWAHFEINVCMYEKASRRTERIR